jgi:hypothetical protein
MKTAEELYAYCQENNFGKGLSKKWDKKHCQLAVNTLAQDEEVLMMFIGNHDFKSVKESSGFCAYLLTDRRLIIAQKRVVGDLLKIVNLNMINDITLRSSIMGILVIDTIKETIQVGLNKKVAKNVLIKINEILYSIKSKKNTTSSPEKDIVKELKGLKELLDQGVLTQAEFDTQKAKLLN